MRMMTTNRTATTPTTMRTSRRFLESGEPAMSVTRIGAGPDGLTLRGPDRDVLDAYARAR